MNLFFIFIPFIVITLIFILVIIFSEDRRFTFTNLVSLIAILSVGILLFNVIESINDITTNESPKGILGETVNIFNDNNEYVKTDYEELNDKKTNIPAKEKLPKTEVNIIDKDIQTYDEIMNNVSITNTDIYDDSDLLDTGTLLE